MRYWDIEKEVEKIIESNCVHYEYEGTEVHKGQMLQDIMLFIAQLPCDKLNTITNHFKGE